MRLFRRTLLCLVVGVTAFGAAGWGLRPRATWELYLGDGDCWFHFARRSDIPSDDAPLWLYARTGRASADEAGKCEVRGVGVNGRLFYRDRLHIGDFDEPYTTTSGGFACHCSLPRDDQPYRTVFTLLAPDGSTEITRTLEGGWEGTGDGAHAFRLSNHPRRQCESVDLRTGNVKSLFIQGLRERLDEVYAAVSPDGRSLALCQAAKRDGPAPRTIELIDLATGKVSRRLSPTTTLRGSGCYAAMPRFILNGRLIEYCWFEPGDPECFETWREHLETNASPELMPFPSMRAERESGQKLPRISPETRIVEAPPAAGTYAVVREVDAALDGRRLWRAVERDSHAAWFALDDGPRTTGVWRRFPFVAAAPPQRGMRHPIFHLPENVDGDIRARLVPGCEALIAWNDNPPAAESLPEVLVTRLPESWGLSKKSFVARWHDCRNNVWREICQGGRVFDLRVRSNALLTTSKCDEGTLLQSWPLPPRDPRPPALAIAALCAAGTWWLCAWRAGRRAGVRNLTGNSPAHTSSN